MARLDNAQEARITAAIARGKEERKTAILADRARYDASSGRVLIELTNGCSYAFPARQVQDLVDASDAELAGVVVDSRGCNLHWAALDVDLDVGLLVAGMFGTKAWMASELARHAGQATSPAKAAASRENGAKGGRPRVVKYYEVGYAEINKSSSKLGTRIRTIRVRRDVRAKHSEPQ